MQMWKFNLNRVIRLNVPPGKRFIKRYAWLAVTVSYILLVLESLRKFRGDSIKEVKMTPQIAFLEHYLNERYATGTAIFISEGYTLGPWVWLSGVPAGETDFYMVEPDNYCYPSTSETNIGFVVNVPHSLEDEVQHIVSLVYKFKLAGKSFIIQLY
jgi:hypothetical protein